MTLLVVVVVILTAIAAMVLGFGVLLAKRIVNSVARPKPLAVDIFGQEVMLPKNAETAAAGEYLLHVCGEESSVIRVGEVLRVAEGVVHRKLVDAVEISGGVGGHWSAHGYSSPDEVGSFESVSVPISGGGTRDAWMFPGDPARWVIHVQGIRTSRSVTLRSVALAQEASATSLAITYRGAGDGPPSKAATLGAREWTELRDAIAYARSQGAQRVTVVAWSMGAALMLELLRHDPHAADDLVLICPVSSWPETIKYGAVQAGLPRQAAGLAMLLLKTRLGAALSGLSGPIDVRRLDWTYPGALPVRTLVIHSRGDEVVPWQSTMKLVDANPDTVTLVETVACPHGFELTVPDENARSHLRQWLIN